MKRLVIVAGLAGLLSGATGMAWGAGGSTGAAGHVSGGVGEAGQQAIKAREGEFNLKLVFTVNEGNYLAGVNVGITDGSGRKVVQDVSDGPFFMANLPAGQYTVSATHDGRTVTRKVQVGAKGLRTEHMRWASNPASDVAVK